MSSTEPPTDERHDAGGLGDGAPGTQVASTAPTEPSQPGRPLPRALRPFRHRDYRLLVGALSASLLSSGLWLVAVAWQVIALGGGPAELSVAATAFSLGLLVCVLF